MYRVWSGVVNVRCGSVAVCDKKLKSPFEKRKRNLKKFSPILRGEREIWNSIPKVWEEKEKIENNVLHIPEKKEKLKKTNSHFREKIEKFEMLFSNFEIRKKLKKIFSTFEKRKRKGHSFFKFQEEKKKFSLGKPSFKKSGILWNFFTNGGGSLGFHISYSEMLCP